MTRRLALLDVATGFAVAAILAGAAWLALKGPVGPLPMHFDATGQPDRWGDRRELAWLVAFLGAVLAATAGGLGWYAARSTDAARRRGLRLAQGLSLIIVGGLVPVIVWQILSAAHQPAAALAGGMGWSMALIGGVCLVTGAVLGRVAPNVAVGVRTPWTFKSRLAWEKSNRLAGRLMFWIGLASLVAVPFAPQPIGFWVAFAALMLAALAAVVESWRVWRTDPERQPF